MYSLLPFLLFVTSAGPHPPEMVRVEGPKRGQHFGTAEKAAPPLRELSPEQKRRNAKRLANVAAGGWK